MELQLQNLANILHETHPLQNGPGPTLRWRDLQKSPYLDSLQEAFESLGGDGDRLPFTSPQWQIIAAEGWVIQLDGPLHFNKYRNVTLRAEAYEKLPGIEVGRYRDYCRKFAGECQKSGMAGQNWSFPAAERYFGEAETPGMFTGNGAPAWKWRAFQDLVQDVASLILSTRLLRLSVYDTLMIDRQLYKLGVLLTQPDETQQEMILRFVNRKLEKVMAARV